MRDIVFSDSFFQLLHQNDIRYCVLELDEDARIIDLFVHPDSNACFIEIMKRNHYKRVGTSTNEYAFIYGLEPDIFWKAPNGSKIHSSCQMSCVSLSNLSKCKLPLDRIIQKSVWENRVWNEKNGCWTVCIEDYLIHLLVTCIFSQKSFDQKSIRWIAESGINWKSISLIVKLEGVFFRFTPELIRHLDECNYQNIIKDYRSFRDY